MKAARIALTIILSVSFGFFLAATILREEKSNSKENYDLYYEYDVYYNYSELSVDTIPIDTIAIIRED